MTHVPQLIYALVFHNDTFLISIFICRCHLSRVRFDETWIDLFSISREFSFLFHISLLIRFRKAYVWIFFCYLSQNYSYQWKLWFRKSRKFMSIIIACVLMLSESGLICFAWWIGKIFYDIFFSPKNLTVKLNPNQKPKFISRRKSPFSSKLCGHDSTKCSISPWKNSFLSSLGSDSCVLSNRLEFMASKKCLHIAFALRNINHFQTKKNHWNR